MAGPDQSRLPPEVRQRISSGERMIARYYDESGLLRPQPLTDEELAAQTGPEPAEGEGDVVAKTVEPGDEQQEAEQRQSEGEEQQDQGHEAEHGEEEAAVAGEPPGVAGQGPDDLAAQVQHLEQSLRTLRGKYNSETAELRQVNRLLSEQLQDVREAQRQRAREPEPAQTTQAEPPGLKPTTAQEQADFGADWSDFIARRAHETIKPLIDKLQSQIGEITSQLGLVNSSVATVRQQTLEQKLDAVMPEWRQINFDPAFVDDWLRQRDPMSGHARKLLLDTAVRDNDAGRVAHIFRAFAAERGKTAQLKPRSAAPAAQGDTPSNGAAPPAGSTEKPKVKLETLVLPGRGRTAPAATEVEAPETFTRVQLKQFNDDVLRGAYRGRDEERKAISDRFERAIAAGRII